VIPTPASFPTDALTKTAIADVERHFPDHPGSLAHFDWPVTPEKAAQALEDFAIHRLPAFGPYQDALWSGETYLYHSRLSAAMNLGLLSPRTAVDAAVAAYRGGAAPLASVEGFMRQIVGWRKFVRGLYWTRMPGYLDMNSLDAHLPLPAFYGSRPRSPEHPDLSLIQEKQANFRGPSNFTRRPSAAPSCN
jgi:deoxyribodipyrimidine photolyase-related protein